MAEVTLRGTPVHTVGELPTVGSPAPAYSLTGIRPRAGHRQRPRGAALLLNIFPSIDTPVCAASVRAFNQRAAEREGVDVLCVSADLPFAQRRFCGAEGIDRVRTASTFRSTFGTDYGVTLVDGSLAGLLARAVVVIGADGTVAYTELVPDIAQEPDYDAALAAL